MSATDTTTKPADQSKEVKKKTTTSYDVLVPIEINLSDQAGLKDLADRYGVTFSALVHAGTAIGQNPKLALATYAGTVSGDASGAYKVVASASVNDFPNVRFETPAPKLVIG